MRRLLARLLKLFAIALIVLVFVALAGAYIFITRSFPQTSGTVLLGPDVSPSLQHRVEIIRDPAGAPNIYAENQHDLFFAQGYVHAQDRLWEMDLNRHVGHGQLAELFGDSVYGESTTVKVDQFLRTIGLDHAARADLASLGDDERTHLQDYADGVNAFLKTHQDNLPVEFTLLGYRPARWTPVDTLVWAKVMAYDLSGNYEDELFNSQANLALGKAKFHELVPAYPSSGPFIIPSDIKSFSKPISSAPTSPKASDISTLPIGRPDLTELKRINKSVNLRDKGVGSNNWVVDGTLTSTGKPLLANDPHLDISMPSIWYMNGIHCTAVSSTCPFDVVGYTFPGVPGVVIGHNQHVAWGVTNTGPDVQDLFAEKLNPANPNQYMYQGQWHEMDRDPEVIHVKDRPDVPFTVQYTLHGPVITPVLKGVTATLALEWTATHDRSNLVKSLLSLDEARNWEDFRNGLRLWDVPAQNFVYADIEGNIGYQMPGRIPVRGKGDGNVPVPGWTGEYDWTNYVPFDELPFVYNPPSHLIVTANNQVVPSEYKYLIASGFAAPFRATRILDLLKSKAHISIDDFKSIQADVYSLPLTNLQKHISKVTPVGFLAERALKYVIAWDGNLSQENIGGTVLEVTYHSLIHDLFASQMDGELFSGYIERGDAHRLLIDQMLNDPNNLFWDDASTASRETRDTRLAKAYMEGVDWLGSQFGDWPPDWHWGRLHTATFAHPFGSIRPLDLILNFGPIAVAGDGYTISNTGLDDTNPYSDQTVSSMREIIDLSNFDDSFWIQTTGESGQPLNPHYTDLTPKWRDSKYEPLYSTRTAVEKYKSDDLVLIP